MNANEIIIPCRLSYANIWEPKQVNGTGDPKYSCCLLIPKSDTKTVQRLQAMIERIKKDPVALAKWGGKLPPEKSFKSPLRDGDEEKDDENYAGCYFINANASEKRHPRIIDRQCNDVLDQDEVYSGCYANVSKYASDGGWSVVCTRCGRVGERGHTQAEAKAKWDAGLFKYGPLKEDKDK